MAGNTSTQGCGRVLGSATGWVAAGRAPATACSAVGSRPAAANAAQAQRRGSLQAAGRDSASGTCTQDPETAVMVRETTKSVLRQSRKTRRPCAA
jgi:hypothetical protein